MSVRHRRGDRLSFRRLLGIALASVSVISVGCDSRPSTEQRLADAYKESGIKPVPCYPLAGKVTVDNETPPSKGDRSSLLVVAYDASKPDLRAADNAFVPARPDGSFEFPALAAGKYVMLFAEVHYRPGSGFRGADGLNNLYNDPDVNAKKPQFVIEHQAAGRTDYEFSLAVAGETPPAAPGPKALVSPQEARRASARK